LRQLCARDRYAEPGHQSVIAGSGLRIERSRYLLQMISASCGWLVPFERGRRSRFHSS
jgi:hypothetical protein